MGETELLAMSRYLAFVAVILALVRAARDTLISYRDTELPLGRILRRQSRNLFLLLICAYYIRALYVPGYEQPDTGDLFIINTLYAMYFFSTTIPKFRRVEDKQPIPDGLGARGS